MCAALALAAGLAPPDELAPAEILGSEDPTALRHGDRLAGDGHFLAIGSPREGDDANLRATVSIGRLEARGAGARPIFVAEAVAIDAAPGEHFGDSIALKAFDRCETAIQNAPSHDTHADTDAGHAPPTGVRAATTVRRPQVKDNGRTATNAHASANTTPRAPVDARGPIGSRRLRAQSTPALHGDGRSRNLALCAIGATNADGSRAATGAVDLFVRSGIEDPGVCGASTPGGRRTPWTREARIASASSSPGDRFGHAVAIGGGIAPTVAVGAPYFDAGRTLDLGAVHIFRRVQSIEPPPAPFDPTTGSMPTTEDSREDTREATRENTTADTAADMPASARDDTADDLSGGGATHAAGSPPVAGVWREHALVACPTASTSAHFGAALAMHDDLVAIAAPDLRVGAAAACGAVWIYRVTLEGCVPVASLPAPAQQAWQWFGADLAMDGATLVVGIPGGRRSADGARCGTVELYDVATLLAAPERAIASRTTLEPSFLEPGAGFGASLALRGSTLLVGAPGADRPSDDRGPAPVLEDAGACLVVRLDPRSQGAAPDATVVAALEPPDPAPSSYFGSACAIIRTQNPASGASGLAPLRRAATAAASNERFDERLGGSLREGRREGRCQGRSQGLHVGLHAGLHAGLHEERHDEALEESSGRSIDLWVAGHRFVEEESWRPSPGAALYAPP